ncbi:MAG TPA: universal stress protein [Vicinamibacterales bacterium]|nr:universal stress protein [Vicinamibacterales bacterium]
MRTEAAVALEHVLVATDFSEPSDKALAYGRALASRFGAALHVLHVVQNVYISTLGAEACVALAPDLQQQLEDGARERLTRLLDADRSGPPTTAVVLTSTSPALAILDYARGHDIDIIVMGTHGRGPLGRLLLGSVAERVVRLAPCPVLTVRHPQRDFLRQDARPAGA